MKSKTRTVAAVVSFTASLVGITAAEAQPAHAASSCPANAPCLYQEPMWSGGIYVFGPGATSGCWNIAGYFDNRTSSIDNNRSRPIVLWQYAGCRGESKYVYENWELSSLGSFDNKASSVSFPS